MPKKIRELRAMLSKAGFTRRSGKGSHTVWTHPRLKGMVAVPGNDGDDAKSYLEKQVGAAIRDVEAAK